MFARGEYLPHASNGLNKKKNRIFSNTITYHRLKTADLASTLNAVDTKMIDAV